jgi:site-specific DNA-methyltransferase (adenine-specific)
MKFKAVVGNPPYNRDLYIDFLVLGHKLSTVCSCMITPAKWQAKGGLKSTNFRKEIAPYIKVLSYYPDCGDIFDIRINGGISYQLICKEKREVCRIKNTCKRVKQFNSNGYTESPLFLNHTDTIVLDVNYIRKIIEKVGVFDKNFESLYNQTSKGIGTVLPIRNNYNAISSSLNTDGGGKTSFHIFSKTGSLTMLGPIEITQDHTLKSQDMICLFTSPNKLETESYVSYLYTRFIRFLILCRYCTFHNNNQETWSFVPKITSLDHIYTDEELYSRYNLTKDEIEVIETTIKSRYTKD